MRAKRVDDIEALEQTLDNIPLKERQQKLEELYSDYTSEELLEASKQIEKTSLQVEIMTFVASSDRFQQEHESQAFGILSEALDIARKTANSHGQYLAYTGLTELHISNDRWQEACRALEKRSEIALQIGYEPEFLRFALMASNAKNYSKAFQVYRKHILWVKEGPAPQQVTEAYLKTGDFLNNLNAHRLASIYYDSAHRELHNSHTTAQVHSGIEYGILYRLMVSNFEEANYDKALAFTDSLMAYLQNPTEELRAASLYYWKGRSHYRKGDFNLAIDAMQRSVDLTKIHKAEQVLPARMEALATVYYKAGDTEKAVTLLNKAYLIAKAKQVEGDMAKISTSLAHCLLSEKKHRQALLHAQEAFRISLTHRLPETEAIAADLLHTIYRELKNYDRSYEYMQLQQQLEDSLKKAKTLRLEAAEQLAFRLEQDNELQKLRLQNEQAARQYSDQRQEDIRNLLFMGLFFFAGISFLIYRNYRLKVVAHHQLASQQKQIIETNKELIGNRDALRKKNEYLKVSQKAIEKKNSQLEKQKEVLASQKNLLYEHNSILKEKQALIEEKNEELNLQKEELSSQRDYLNEQHIVLKEKQVLIEEKNEELLLQKEEIASQRDSLNVQHQELKQKQALIENKNKKLEKQSQELKATHKQISMYNKYLNNIVKIRTQELGQTQTQLGKKQSELDTFLYHASHNLLRPLSSIQGLLNLLKDSSDQESINTFTQKIEFVNQEMMLMLRKLIMVSVIGYHEQNKETASLIDVKRAIEKSISLLKTDRPDLSYGSILISSSKKIELSTHAEILEYLFYNLIENALTFHQFRKVECFISARTINEKLVIQIKDNGIGISDSQSYKVYNMFYRGSDLSKGNGLGLYVSKRASEILGAELHFESEIGKGTVFTATFPLETS